MGFVQLGFNDYKNRLEALSKFGYPLLKLSKIIDFEVFRKELEKALSLDHKKGRPPYDAVLMFKILTIQTLYNLF